MPELTIVAGAEPTKIIPELQAGQEFNLAHTSGGKVHLDHNKRDVKNDPQRVSTVGDEGPIRSPDVSDVWAYAPDETATLRVSPKGFIWDLFSNKASERPSDKAVREQNQDTFLTQVTAAAGEENTETRTASFFDALDIGFPMAVDNFEIALNADPGGGSLERGGDFSQDVYGELAIKDASGDFISRPGTYLRNSGVRMFEPGIFFPDGGTIDHKVVNAGASSVDVDFLVQVREL